MKSTRRRRVGVLVVAGVVGIALAATAVAIRDHPNRLAVLVPERSLGGVPYLWAGCSATMLREFVVTAAHCVQNQSEIWHAVGGVSDLCEPVPAEARISGPLRVVSINVASDLAILTDQSGGDLSAIEGLTNPAPGSTLDVWGYSASSEAGPRPCRPHHTTQIVVDLRECASAGMATTGKLCVRNGDDEHTVCTGDSGGPVLAGAHVVGVTSTGLDCLPGSLGTVALIGTR